MEHGETQREAFSSLHVYNFLVHTLSLRVWGFFFVVVVVVLCWVALPKRLKRHTNAHGQEEMEIKGHFSNTKNKQISRIMS